MKLFIERLKRIFTGVYKDLGWMNGWKETPKEYIFHSKKNHKVWVNQFARCGNDYKCPVCKIKWSVDSGD
jgi:hypothetical protein